VLRKREIIFFVVGGIIFLLQLIPVGILFFSFVSATASIVLKSGKRGETGAVRALAKPVAVE
jgi:hypothetical protein